MTKELKAFAGSKMNLTPSFFLPLAPPGWLSGERVGLMTWWLLVRSLVEATFLSGVFSPLMSAEACEKSSWWLWKKRLCLYWCEKARKHICVTDRHDMTLAVKVALNPNTTNQPMFPPLEPHPGGSVVSMSDS